MTAVRSSSKFEDRCYATRFDVKGRINRIGAKRRMRESPQKSSNTYAYMNTETLGQKKDRVLVIRSSVARRAGRRHSWRGTERARRGPCIGVVASRPSFVVHVYIWVEQFKNKDPKKIGAAMRLFIFVFIAGKGSGEADGISAGVCSPRREKRNR